MTESPELKKLADTVVLAMSAMPEEAQAPYLIEMANSFAERCVAATERPDWDDAKRRDHLLQYAALFGQAVSERLERMKASGGSTSGKA
jgi:hypothetical protein